MPSVLSARAVRLVLSAEALEDLLLAFWLWWEPLAVLHSELSTLNRRASPADGRAAAGSTRAGRATTWEARCAVRNNHPAEQAA